jgi:hypothetical protein
MLGNIHTLAKGLLKFQHELLTIIKIITESGPHSLLREWSLCICNTYQLLKQSVLKYLTSSNPIKQNKRTRNPATTINTNCQMHQMLPTCHHNCPIFQWTLITQTTLYKNFTTLETNVLIITNGWKTSMSHTNKTPIITVQPSGCDDTSKGII